MEKFDPQGQFGGDGHIYVRVGYPNFSDEWGGVGGGGATGGGGHFFYFPGGGGGCGSREGEAKASISFFSFLFSHLDG